MKANPTPYTLYWRCHEGNEPKQKLEKEPGAKYPRFRQDYDHVWLPRYGSGRGGVLGRYERYKDLVADAQNMCRLIGVPVSRWMDIFDWNK